MGRLSGKVAIVTGASRGIGKGIATVLGREGAAVVVAARSVEPRPGLAGSIGETADAIAAAGGRAIAVQCDITDEASVDALFQRTLDEFGRIDLLVNNAGGSGTFAPVEGYPMRRFDRVVALNIRGTFLCCRAAIGPMTRQGGGVIVNVSSDSAQKLAFPDDAIYGMVKAGIERLTRGLAKELEGRGVSVVAFWPAAVKTEGAQAIHPPDFDWSGWIDPEDVGPGVVDLATGAAARYNGQVLDLRRHGKDWP